jgi:hypothetical protein
MPRERDDDSRTVAELGDRADELGPAGRSRKTRAELMELVEGPLTMPRKS